MPRSPASPSSTRPAEYGFTVRFAQTLWFGDGELSVTVHTPGGQPAGGAAVRAVLADDSSVTAAATTDSAGQATFTHLPDRTFELTATAPGNLVGSVPATIPDSPVTLTLAAPMTPSPIDNNDFAGGTADGWEVGTAPVEIVPHVEGPLGGPAVAQTRTGTAAGARGTRAAKAQLPAPKARAAAADFDLQLNTAGEGEQRIGRAFKVEPGYRSVVVRYRFVTTEVPGGFFGTKYNDYFSIDARTLAGGTIHAGNSMNGLGLWAFDAAGATAWYTVEMPVEETGDEVQFFLGVANVADGLFPSAVVVDLVQKKRLTISALSLNDIDNSALQRMSVSAHGYFGGVTRVHGSLTVEGDEDDTLQELTLEVVQAGAVVATGTLEPGLTGTLYRRFGDTETIELAAVQLLFRVPAADVAAGDQVSLRVRARSAGDTAQKDFGAVQKLERYAAGNRYGGRDEAVGGDDWVRPGVRTFLTGIGAVTWGDMSNMHGGTFAPHQTHQVGHSADGWFAGYNARNAATAATVVAQLNANGLRITQVYVTFTPAFQAAIQGVVLTDGRQAVNVIRNVAGHDTHFHWEMTEA
ncbi:hypothetical protein Asp14428_03270 [Actinoplanes sp. NBRC 14428]|nr:hypothetical protein Asp14428_03270 [Actinoplanes sp. NBRC 14428]